MPLTVQLEDVVEEYRVGSKPQAVIRFRRMNAGHVEDAVQESTDRKGSMDPSRYGAALWGRLIVGWEGVLDTKGKPVPFEAPREVLERVRAQVKEAGGKLSDDAILERAQGEWVYAVLRGFPPSVKTELQRLTSGDRDSVANALGN